MVLFYLYTGIKGIVLSNSDLQIIPIYLYIFIYNAVSSTHMSRSFCFHCTSAKFLLLHRLFLLLHRQHYFIHTYVQIKHVILYFLFQQTLGIFSLYSALPERYICLLNHLISNNFKQYCLSMSMLQIWKQYIFYVILPFSISFYFLIIQHILFCHTKTAQNLFHKIPPRLNPFVLLNI